MKNIKNFLTEAKDITFEPSPREYKWSPNAKFMYVTGNIETEGIVTTENVNKVIKTSNKKINPDEKSGFFYIMRSVPFAFSVLR